MTISEPSTLDTLAKMIEDKECKAERLVVSTLRLLCKPTKMKECGYLLKVAAPSTSQLDKFTAALPNSTNLFMYRDRIKVGIGSIYSYFFLQFISYIFL